MFGGKKQVRVETERLTLRLPQHGDFQSWTSLRRDSEAFLTPWEPAWAPDHLARKSFANRVYWAARAVKNETALPLFIVRREDDELLGAITLDHIRRGPAQSGTLGYWIGERHARQGYMLEAIDSVVYHAFHRMDLSRIEAACLPENKPSRDLLEKCGFKYEGVAQSYLEIAGRWRTHVLYAHIRLDRRGRAE
ncbi:GNAT family N-acetyltransferase [Thalassovita mediterranea]|jgi:ribosomal-protein-alanine N-acetyltransferase|uniref:Ribosomal-protein-serine acetyltransferase n=1 Tax=Thalassovita mediterranea TaxID=340021 RepID=A0A0P1GNV9_9RHOB|nr:GNAT family protein [Thalassovita mediterranea]MCG7574247.1 GNAT family N-acetyltransferase [Phaeobacter sp. CNT1-3]CUH83973.1 Ribosomal-protein-serine acetyltransferase [Thalassovita mediterranea]SIS27994.1 ribosomal-protein-alanine N-acetyltransferase [Thalassovita mediterranea]